MVITNYEKTFCLHYLIDHCINDHYIYISPSGEYRNNKPHGKGKWTGANRDQYIGDYYENSKQGKGIMIYAGSGRQYSGDFRNHFRHGRGKVSFKDGSSYEVCVVVCVLIDI